MDRADTTGRGLALNSCQSATKRLFRDGSKERLAFEREPTTELFETSAFHATLEEWIGGLLDAGFNVRGIREPEPTESALRAHPDLEDACRIPDFLMFDLQRRR
jgi:hypothetical protein